DTDVTIPFTLSGSATEGSDFSISTNPLTIPAGQIAANITVTVTDDTLDEPDETVTVTLGTPTGATLGNRTTHTVTINDNDLPPLPTVTLSSQAQMAAENAGDVTVTATLSSTSTTNVTVPLTITGTATDGSDFTIASSSVTIPAGQTSATISISILNDTADEPDETIIVTLNEPTGATLGAVTSHTVTVQDDDPPAGTPIVNFTTNSLTVAETSSVTMLTATLSIASEFDVSIPFSVSGTATDGSDFAVSSSPLIIPAGQTAASIEVTITEDTLDENDETVVVALQTPTGAVLGTETQRTITIADNDDPAPTPSVQFAATAQDAAENAGTVSVSVNLSNVADVDVTIPFSIAGDATAGDDFTVSTSPLTIPAGQTTGTINVSLIDDVILESTETISITLGTPTGGDLGANSVHVITINDDEFISNGDNRIIIPDFVARPHVVPGDGRPTAILFKALEDTVLTVTKVNTLSLTEEIIVLDQNLTPVGGPDNDGQFTANLNSQGLYAIILQGQSEESIFVVRSSEGFASLTGATTNILLPTDVNADGSSTSLDALLVINQLQRETLLEGEEIESQVARYYDVNRDGVVSATDVLRIINYMSRQSDQLAPGTNNADAEQVDDSPVDAAIATLSEVAAKIVSVDSGNATATSSVVVGSDPVDEVLSDESALDELLASLN
ncbi:MAG: Calx-beta domain-containing protein, partial [Rubripirellula sp.]